MFNEWLREFILFIPKEGRIYRCKFWNNANIRSEVKAISNKVLFLFPSLLNEIKPLFNIHFCIYAVSSALILILSIYIKQITYHYAAFRRGENTINLKAMTTYFTLNCFVYKY